MKLYNILQDIILEEISKDQELINEGVLEDIKAAMEKSVYIRFKYKDEKGVITNRYGVVDKEGTSLANNGVIRFWQTGGSTTNSKGREDGGQIGYKLFRIDRIIPNSIELTNMKSYSPIKPAGIKYNPNGDRKMRGAITVANYKN
jgi:hypothetical protein